MGSLRRNRVYPQRLPTEQIEKNRASKDTTTHNIPAPVPATTGYKEFQGVAANEIKEHIIKNKFIDSSSQEISMDPAKIQSMENNIASDLGKCGLELEDFLRISKPGHIDLCRKYPVWYASVTCELVGLTYAARPKDKRPTPTDHVKEAEEVQALAKEELKPEPSKKGFSLKSFKKSA